LFDDGGLAHAGATAEQTGFLHGYAPRSALFFSFSFFLCLRCFN
jgi:hypothetical protein